MTDTFKEIGSLFGREGAGAGFAKQTDKESFTYAFAWPEGDTWATLTGMHCQATSRHPADGNAWKGNVPRAAGIS